MESFKIRSPVLVEDLKQYIVKLSETRPVLYMDLESAPFCIQYLILIDPILLPRTFIPVIMGHCTFQPINSVSLQKFSVAALYHPTHSSNFLNFCFLLIQPISLFQFTYSAKQKS